MNVPVSAPLSKKTAPAGPPGQRGCGRVSTVETDPFWALVNASGTDPADLAGRTRRLRALLATLPPDDIVDLDRQLAAVQAAADTPVLRAAVDRVCAGLHPVGGHRSFVNWLTAQGRAAYEQVVADPDSLAGLPVIRRLATRPTEAWTDDEWPEWEALSGLPAEAYALVTGDADGLRRARLADASSGPADPLDGRGAHSTACADQPVEPYALPRLAALFPVTDGPARRQARGRAVFERLLAERGQTAAEFLADPR